MEVHCEIVMSCLLLLIMSSYEKYHINHQYFGVYDAPQENE